MNRVEKLCSHLSGASLNPTSAKQWDRPVRVVVTGAAGNIAYSALFGIGRGKLLGENTRIDLRLLDIEPMKDKIQGVLMELQDCAFPVLASITATTSYEVAFKDADVCLLIGAKPRGPGMLRKDLLKANAKIFEGQGKAINAFASKDVKIVVVGNPANTNALITQHFAPSIPKENFTALTRLDQNRAVSQISDKISRPVESVRNTIIWGNHSKTQYPDVNHSFVSNFPQAGSLVSTRAAVNDDEWVDGHFITTVQNRGAAIIKARGASSAASAANAVLDHVRDWINGTPAGEWVSMAVASDGSYNIPKGIVYSFPVTCSAGTYKIVQGLPINTASRKLMDATAAELVDERQQALGF